MALSFKLILSFISYHIHASSEVLSIDHQTLTCTGHHGHLQETH